MEAKEDRFDAAVVPAPPSAADNGVPVASLSGKVRLVISAVVRISTGTGSGSGVIIQTQGNTGYVITNQHVVRGVDRAQVTAGDGANYWGELLGSDATRDLAVLKICCGGFSVAQFGDTEGLEPATEVLVIG